MRARLFDHVLNALTWPFSAGHRLLRVLLTLALLLPALAQGGIGITALATKTGLAPANSITFSNVTVATTGSTLVVTIGYMDGGNGAEDGVTWNGTPMTFAGTVGAGGPGATIYYISNATAATGSVVVDLSTATTWLSYCIHAQEVTGAATTSFDLVKSANATSATPSTGATATLAQANEEAVAAIAWQNTSVTGTWGTFANLQSTTVGAAAAAVALETGNLTTAATTAITANKTGAANKAWAAIVATFKEAPAATNGASGQRGDERTGGVPSYGRARIRGGRP